MRMNIQKEIEKELAREVKRTLNKNCTHNFIDAKDGTCDKVCTICGIRAKQAVMKFNS